MSVDTKVNVRAEKCALDCVCIPNSIRALCKSSTRNESFPVCSHTLGSYQTHAAGQKVRTFFYIPINPNLNLLQHRYLFSSVQIEALNVSLASKVLVIHPGTRTHSRDTPFSFFALCVTSVSVLPVGLRSPASLFFCIIRASCYGS